MDSIREQILQALALKMSADRSKRSDTIVLYDDIDETPDAEISNYDSIYSTINVRAEYVHDLTEAEIGTQSTLMNNKKAEINQLATSGDVTLGGLCLTIKEANSGWEPRESGSNTVAAYVFLEIPYIYDRGNPFTNLNKP